MTDAPKSLPRLALPLVISFTLRFLFQTVDLIYAAYLDEPGAAIAAIGFWAPFQAVFIAIWVGLSAGFTSSLANAFGHRDEPRILALKRAIWRILTVVVPILTLAGGALWFAVPEFGLEPDLTAAFRTYGTTLCLGLPLASFWSIYPDSIIKAHHQMRLTMIAGLVATGVNITLNTWFVFGLDLGVFGLALATVLSRIASLVYAAHQARILERQRLGEDMTWFEPKTTVWPHPMRAILTLSLPASVMFVLGAVESGVINGLLSRLPSSTDSIAAFAVFERMAMLASMPAIGASVAVLPYVARNLAEGRAAEVAANLRRILIYAAIAGLVFSVPVGLLFPAAIGAFFFDEVSDRAISLLQFLPLAVLALLPFLILRPVFEAAQRPRIGILLAVLRFVVLSIPLLLLGRYLAPEFGLDPLIGIVAGTITATTIASIATVVLCQRLESNRAAAERAT